MKIGKIKNLRKKELKYKKYIKLTAYEILLQITH